MTNQWLDTSAGMNKLVDFPGESSSGERLIHTVQPTKSGIIKTAAELHPSVTAYMSTAERASHYVYILVVALGAGEVYGQNINGDYFPWEALRHDSKSIEGQRLKYPFGFQSFYDACFFAHHQNKNPDKRLGDVVHVVLNETMKRIDLVIRVDRRMCEKFNAIDTWAQVSSGDRIDVSMGAKVPFDLCRITTDWAEYRKAYDSYNPAVHPHLAGAIIKWHEEKKKRDGIGIQGLARTRVDYSDYCKNQMGKILSDGRQVGVVNTLPKFFDISNVVVRADRIARQLTKLAAAGSRPHLIIVSSAERGEDEMRKVAGLVEREIMEAPRFLDRAGKALANLYRKEDKVEALLEDPQQLVSSGKPTGYEKFKSAVKTSAYHKVAELLKNIEPDQVTGKVLRLLEPREEDIPSRLLDTSADRGGIHKTLSTSAVLGMLLKPHEFQRVVLSGSGRKNLADRLEEEGKVFEVGRPGFGMDLLAPEALSAAVRSLLLALVRRRSLFMPALTRRIMVIDVTPPKERTFCSLEGDLGNSMSGLYTDYRRDLLKMLIGGPMLDHAERDDQLVKESCAAWGMTKESEVSVRNLMGYLTIPALMYLYASGLKKRSEGGEDLSAVKEFVKDHPLLVGGFGAALAGVAKNPDLFKRLGLAA